MGNQFLDARQKGRKVAAPISPLIAGRWSSRSMTEDLISEEEVQALFEAARWAPSSYNNQPWRFLYAHRKTPQWDVLYSLLVDFNQSWCRRAAVLLLICSLKSFERNGKPSRTHLFDTGAAWMNLSLEGSARGLVVHGMEGFSYERARGELGVPEAYEIVAMAAIGKYSLDTSHLPPSIADSEKPGERKPVQAFIIHPPQIA